MEMRQPVKQLQEQWAPLSQSCLGGENEAQGLGACGSCISLVLVQQLVLHNRRSLLRAADPERQFLHDRVCTLRGLWQSFFCLFVCLLGVGFLIFLGFVVLPPQMAFDCQAK